VSAEIGGQPLDNDRIYVLATRGYMGRGKDGYRSLLVRPEGGECEEVVSEENGMLISAMLRQYFMSLTVLAKWKGWCPSMDRHWYACPFSNVSLELFCVRLTVGQVQGRGRGSQGPPHRSASLRGAIPRQPSCGQIPRRCRWKRLGGVDTLQHP
jgi:hypothetical protein